MPLMSKPSSAARTSLIYITLGALMIIWSAIWYWWLHSHEAPGASDTPFYFCTGFLITGLTLTAIGFALGRIGRAARHAELPPPEVTQAEAQVDKSAAARAPMMAPMNPAAGTAMVNGQVVAPVAGVPGVTAAPAVPVVPPPVNIPRKT